ncbi:MAG: AAA family ATPase [Bernardetiaceae bacterium]|nr:AAA family ATPase [Bernardetiaceae bacterium]MDW8302633.1 AAA family ATPase [Bacteroidia bacterium]
MTIFETFKGYSLTNGQQELLINLNEFLEDRTFCFLLKGYAGTGKTFMMKGLTDFLKSVNRHFVLAAPTGRAAKVISQRTKSKAYTIHKIIYSNRDIKEFKTKNTDGTETFKFYYDLKNNKDPANTIYIIDEASMISDMYSEDEFFRFGSGFLLKDLLRYINFDNNDHKKKIIFIGDNAQLPPVNMNFSPALNEQYLREKYQVSVSSYELTEVVRQQKDSGILHNATKIRASLKSNVFNQIDIETNFADTKPVQQQDLLKTYLQACGNQIDDETIIIAYSNSSVKEYNDFVRSHFFPNQSTITKGDRIILVSNNYNYQIELLNGDFGIIQEVSPTNETRNITLKRKNKSGNVVEIKVPLHFRNVTIQFKDTYEKTYDIECKIIENVLYSKENDLSSDELKALYVDFKIRNPFLKAGTKELKDALRTDKYFNALRIKFGYAITCHKAQGGEWKRAFIDCKTAMGYFNASYFRWLYTALTRAKEVLYTLDEPHFRIGSSLKPPKIENFTPRRDLIVLKPEILQTELAFDFSDEQENLKAIFYAVFDLIKDEGITIDSIRHVNWCEHYTFSKGTEKCVLKIDYNAKNKISSIQKTTNSAFANSLVQHLQILVDKTIVLDTKIDIDTIEVKTFDFAEPFLQDFYDFVLSKVSTQNISVIDIKQNQWLQKYIFKKGSFVAEIDFYYNGKKQFNRFVPQPQKSTSIELLNEIISLIGNLK